MTPFSIASILLFLAALFGVINHLVLKLPNLIGVLVIALAASMLTMLIDPWIPFDITGYARVALETINLPHFLLDFVLAFLLFAGSLHVDVAALQRQGRAIFALATASVAIFTVLFAFGIQYVFGWLGADIPFDWCAVLGAILAPTDAVVVMALLQRGGLPESTRMLIVGESLFNDGVAVVVFLIALGATEGTKFNPGSGHALGEIAQGVLGGLLVGAITGWLAYRTLRLVNDYILELTISLALASCTYALAQAVGASGPIAVVAAGLLIGNHATEFGTSRTSHTSLITFWSLVDELLNTLLFLMIGLELMAVETRRLLVLATLAAIPLALLVRLVSVAVPLLLTRLNTMQRLRALGVLGWGGLRGGISVALALSLPDGPYREPLLTVCYGLVVFTILVQGLTMPWFVRKIFGAAGVPRAEKAGASPPDPTGA